MPLGIYTAKAEGQTVGNVGGVKFVQEEAQHFLKLFLGAGSLLQITTVEGVKQHVKPS